MTSRADLDGFRHAQQLAYACAESVAATLEVGVSERQAAAWMRRWLRDQGVDDWFYLPFAWFGDRTTLLGFRFPLWNGGRFSDRPPCPGLWAVEPHLGTAGGLGAKFEELLVVIEDGAYWLDDDLPHVRRWRQREGAQR